MNINKINNFLFTVALIFLTPSVFHAQIATKKPTSADIYENIKKLNVLGAVLFVAAHPDDENTRLISYFANAKHMDITYLSLTRGDGGQNLIGNELREYLGVLRTQELLMARSVDGGKQLFTRANDFGFSKSPAETFRIWGKQEVLADLIWGIRKVQPDIIINRFSTDTTVDTHGHHTGSAVLSNQAFDMTGDPSVFPEQMAFGVKAWQPQRLFCNQTWWFYGSQDTFKKVAEREKFISFDAGVYLPIRGKSNDEIAAESRSMHKCQGMGMMSSRGTNMEYLQYLKGNKGDAKPVKDPFEGINTTWTRLEGGEEIGKLMASIEQNFKFDNPSSSITDLLKARTLIQNLPESTWKTRKLADIEQVIQACTGLYAEAISKEYAVTVNGKTEVNLEIINRSDINIDLQNIQLQALVNRETGIYHILVDTINKESLKNNIRKSLKINLQLTGDGVLTNAYWLEKKPSLGLYNVSAQRLRGIPETPRALQAVFNVMVQGQPLKITVPIVNSFANPAKGETYRPLEVTPSVFVNIEEHVYVFGDENAKNVDFVVKSAIDNLKGRLKPSVPKGWTLEPESLDFSLKLKGEETVLTFKLTPPKEDSEGNIEANVYLKMGEKSEDYEAIATKSVKFIEYDHIPTQTVLQTAASKIVKINILKRGINIGYFMGAGDEMPACLAQIGYQITQLSEHDLQNTEGLKKYDAIVVGIRAYNTKEKLKFYNQKLLEYVNNGGTMVVQYNTAGRDLVLPQFGPYPFKLGRGRTTEEDAPVRFLKPEHPVLNVPNKITSKDFEGWVQERGLYFLSEWDKNYDAVLSCNDTNEKPEDGGLITAKYGKGWYIYTGYSFFRELPMGVPGAYRLFANMLSIGKLIP